MLYSFMETHIIEVGHSPFTIDTQMCPKTWKGSTTLDSILGTGGLFWQRARINCFLLMILP
jgi:hypothetical protein